ncbi:2OG-Fe(II) oxygenase [Temperatibacter marinus]|uniref:2OG-Fe(II) oxygenase n=1 Tax=Temperatibacter marinus TaxID=1456591 RepID=A0AA52EDC3_9PROT|nr:2OG-Fe(II) oxygenase [Temperatibacter marinus]WND03377.1 2OG-Fe(II) oxygenase [Temperatibacter marinus]
MSYGYSIQPNLLPESLANQLVLHIHSDKAPTYKPAGIGRQKTQQHNPEIRRDKTAWTDQERCRADHDWHLWSERLRHHLNRELLLGLSPIESHYACYQKGDFYSKHMDAFHGQSNRRLSLVAFLNPRWQSENAGQLVLYTGVDNTTRVQVSPMLGTVAFFMSTEIPHEVLPTTCTRHSIAGWYG